MPRDGVFTDLTDTALNMNNVESKLADHKLWGLAISSDDKSFVYKHLRIKHNLPAVPEVARKYKPTCRCRGRRPFAG